MPATLESVTGSDALNSTKISNILRRLLQGQSLNRFEAERLGDHCLPSTISTLANDHGLTIKRTPEQVRNRFGTLTRVIRYSLPKSERPKARRVLKELERRNPRKKATP